MFLTLRIIHIVMGVFWAGTMFFMVSYLMPSLVSAGSGAGPVAAELARRKLFQRLPVIAVFTVVSGFWMYYLRMQGSEGWAPTMEARTLGLGGVTGFIALVYGLVSMRPNQEQSIRLGQEAAAMPAGVERDALMARATMHRNKSVMGSRVVAALLGITVITMAIARYL